MESNDKSGNDFFGGFLLGALVGAAIVFLLGTKRGKKILKAISEEGAGNFSTILDKINKSVDIEDEYSGDDELLSAQPVDKEVNREESSIGKVSPKTRRFFRGISRRN